MRKNLEPFKYSTLAPSRYLVYLHPTSTRGSRESFRSFGSRRSCAGGRARDAEPAVAVKRWSDRVSATRSPRSERRRRVAGRVSPRPRRGDRRRRHPDRFGAVLPASPELGSANGRAESPPSIPGSTPRRASRPSPDADRRRRRPCSRDSTTTTMPATIATTSSKDSVTIGRGGIAYPVDIRIVSSLDVSREHARIRRDAADRPVLPHRSELARDDPEREARAEGIRRGGRHEARKRRRDAAPGSARIGLADTVYLDFGWCPDGAPPLGPFPPARRTRRRSWAARLAWSAEANAGPRRPRVSRHAYPPRTHRPLAAPIPGSSARSTRTASTGRRARGLHRHRRRGRAGRRWQGRRRRAAPCFGPGSNARRARPPIACARRSRSPTTRSIGLPRCGRSGRAWPASSPSPSSRMASARSVTSAIPGSTSSARADRENHARSLAGWRARGCARALRTRGDAAPAPQRGVPRRRLRAARAGRSGLRRPPRDPVRARLGAAALQRRADRPGRSATINRIVKQLAGDPQAVVHGADRGRERRRRQGQRHRGVRRRRAVRGGGLDRRGRRASRRRRRTSAPARTAGDRGTTRRRVARVANDRARSLAVLVCVRAFATRLCADPSRRQTRAGRSQTAMSSSRPSRSRRPSARAQPARDRGRAGRIPRAAASPERRPSGEPACRGARPFAFRRRVRARSGGYRVGRVGRRVRRIPHRRRCCHPARYRSADRRIRPSQSWTSRLPGPPRSPSTSEGPRPLVGSDIRDNPGAAMAIRARRVRGGSSTARSAQRHVRRAQTSVIVETRGGADVHQQRLSWAWPAKLSRPGSSEARAAFGRDNWFVDARRPAGPPRRASPRPARSDDDGLQSRRAATRSTSRSAAVAWLSCSWPPTRAPTTASRSSWCRRADREGRRCSRPSAGARAAGAVLPREPLRAGRLRARHGWPGTSSSRWNTWTAEPLGCHRRGPLAAGRAVHIAIQFCRFLQAATRFDPLVDGRTLQPAAARRPEAAQHPRARRRRDQGA